MYIDVCGVYLQSCQVIRFSFLYQTESMSMSSTLRKFAQLRSIHTLKLKRMHWLVLVDTRRVCNFLFYFFYEYNCVVDLHTYRHASIQICRTINRKYCYFVKGFEFFLLFMLIFDAFAVVFFYFIFTLIFVQRESNQSSNSVQLQSHFQLISFYKIIVFHTYF